MNIVPVLKQVFVSFLLAFLGFGLNFVAKVIDDHLYVQTVKANPQLLADLLDVYFGFVIAALGYVIEKDISKGGKGLVVIVFVLVGELVLLALRPNFENWFWWNCVAAFALGVFTLFYVIRQLR
jgi:hypothetical protein